MKLVSCFARLMLPVWICVLAVAAPVETAPPLNTPPQDQGLPYTRSAHELALARIKEGIAVFAGSRYGYIHGIKVRLDDKDLLHAEAVEKEGVVYVPGSFAALVGQPNLQVPPVPAELASISDRWVYAPSDLVKDNPGLLKDTPSAGVATITVGDQLYYSLADIGRKQGLIVTELPSGLVYLGKSSLSFKEEEKTLLESVITLFDTPEKYADPDIATKYIPTLNRQGRWTDHVKVTPEQLAILNGPETDWPTTPKSQYDLIGFNSALLGSVLPPPGVYPRVLFSPEDVPVIAARIKSTTVGKMSLIEMQKLFEKTWWDPSTSDGQVFQKLADGDVKGLEWDCLPGTPAGCYPHVFKGQKPGIYNSHIYYNEQCLTSMALYCLLTNDDVHGRQAAAAIANYYKLREPLLDEINSISDSEYGSSFHRPDGSLVTLEGLGSVGGWRTHGGLGGGIGAHMDLGLALDFSGKWMTPEQKDGMRRFIAKATYGYRAYGQNGPRRWRDVNWVAWDLSSYLALASIEGLTGFDPEAYASETETVKAFCDFGIDDAGVIYESNGKTPGGLQFLTLAMTGMARRGENYFGHPHIRKFLEAQVQSTSPTGLVVVNSGTQYSPYSRQRLSYQFLLEMKGFFPSERSADYLLGSGNQSDTVDEDFVQQAMPGAKLPLDLTPWKKKTGDAVQSFSLDSFPAQVDAAIHKLRLPGPTYPGFVPGLLLDGDCQETTREELKLPLDFSDNEHGLFSSYSDRSPQAAWINMLVRPDHYLGAGHHHADGGMFHFSALGIDWFTQSPFDQSYEGKYFNLVQVDGHSEPESVAGNAYNARAKYLGAAIEPSAAAASADLTYAYSYRWLTQPPKVWTDQLSSMGWELEPNPDVLKIFAGTTRYKMRPWWPTKNTRT